MCLVYITKGFRARSLYDNICITYVINCFIIHYLCDNMCLVYIPKGLRAWSLCDTIRLAYVGTCIQFKNTLFYYPTGLGLNSLIYR